MDCPEDMDELTIPEGVRRISKNALSRLYGVGVLHLPSTLEKLPQMLIIGTPR